MGELPDKPSVEVCEFYKRLAIFEISQRSLVKDILDLVFTYLNTIPYNNASQILNFLLRLYALPRVYDKVVFPKLVKDLRKDSIIFFEGFSINKEVVNIRE